jgi:hypothetical protein
MNLPAARAENPFGSQVATENQNALVQSGSQREIQEVQAAMVIAKKFPRDSMRAMDRIINACTRPTLAQSALYSYPRGGQEVTGPSIRLAEAMAQEWGNIQFGIRELSAENGNSTVEAFAWDMETNTRQVKVFQVGHTRYSRNGGNQKLTDPRDIYELVANQGARRLRACILGVIPGDVTEAAVQQCEVTQASTIEVTPEAIKKMLEYFADNWGVPQELIEKRIGRRADAINAPLMLNLRKIVQSLKDGMSKPSDWFDIDAATETVAPKVSDLNADLGAKKAAKKKAPAATDPDKPADAAPAPKPEPEPEELPLAAATTYADVMAAINAADSPETIQAAKALMIGFCGEGDNSQFQEELGAAYRYKLSELKGKK